ncbi:MAG: POTRA domain-containing protein, partial [Fibrobacterota bacterium]
MIYKTGNWRLAFMLLLVCSTLISSQTVTTIICQITEQSPGSQELQNIAKKLIVVKENEPLDTASLNESVQALQLCRLFQTVKVEVSQGTVTFLLTPAQYVQDISIRRELPLFEKDLEMAMSTYPGDIFSDDLLAQQDTLITALYKREGLIRPQVDISSRKHRTGDNQDIIVHVHAGDYYRLNTFDIKGNKAFSNLHIKQKMKSWRTAIIPGSSGRFVESILSTDLKAITKFYKAKRFADIEIKDTVITDSINKTVKVILSINEGDRYKVTFSRRHDRGFRKGILRKDIALYKTGNRNNIGIKKTVKAIEKRMRENGFHESKVSASDTTILHRRFTEKLVHISIKRGPRTTVSSIKFENAKSLDEKAIRGQMLHVDKGSKSKRAFDPEKLIEDAFAVQMLYRSSGFLSATAESNYVLKDRTAAITINVHEGTRTLIDSVLIDTERFNTINIKKAVTIKKGDTYRKDLPNRDARALQTIIAEQGFPHVKVTPVVTMSGDSTTAFVELRITEGPLVTMGDIHYIGAFRTRDKVLNRELKASPEKPLSLKDIIDTQKGVRDLGLFSSVRFRTIGLREKRDTVQVFVEVAEKRPYYGTVGGGYQSDKGPFVHAKAGDRNVLGLNKEVWVATEANQISLDVNQIGGRGELGILEPRLFGSHIRAMAQVYGEKISNLNQNWETREYGLSISLIYPLGKHTVIGLGSSYKRLQLFLENGFTIVDSTEITDDQHPRNLIILTPSITWDRRDSYTRPRKGAVLGTSVDISKNVDNTLDDIIKIQAEAKGYVTPFSPLTFAAVLRGGYLLPYGRTSLIPVDRHFYLGGTGDLRGFEQNLFNADKSGGSTMLFASVEARIDAGFNIELTGFTDI